MVNPGAPITVKLHGSRRLFQPGTARSVTSSELQAQMRDAIAVFVRDAATGADITDQVFPPRSLSPRRSEH